VTPNIDRVAAFRALHARGELLVLPNAWDAGSAALIESCGARAIATTSAAVAWSHGHPDGEKLPKAALLQTVSEILRVVRVPLSVDSEAGLSRSPDEVAAFVLELIALGAVGINLEDGTEPPELLAAKISAVKSAAKRAGCDVFVNARTDVLLKQLVPPHQVLPELLARAERYARAGADGLFVPLLAEPDAIRKVAGAVDLPLNLLAIPSLASGPELRALGVRRLSAGSGVAQVALAAAQGSVERFLADGDSARLLAMPTRLTGMNALLARA
jgi:2-methylisocitrate lyase-like PEP mutase family enzyme